MVNPLTNAIAEYLNLTGNGTSTEWVQIGGYQGTVGVPPCPGPLCLRSETFVHLYAENFNQCAYDPYHVYDFGVPDPPNRAVYVNWTGGTQLTDCGYFKKFSFRVGSYSNPPVATGVMSVGTGYSVAALEDRYVHATPREPIGTVRFGLDHNFNVNDSYGLHLYKQSTGQWLLWNDANSPGTQWLADPPLVYVQRKAWSAFQVHD